MGWDGIVLFDSQNHKVYGNTLFWNVVNTLGKYFDPRGNITNGTSAAHAHSANASTNNNFAYNVIIPSLPMSDAFDMDSNSLVSGSNNFGVNQALAVGGSHYYHYAGSDGDNQTTWNTIDFPGGGNDTFGTIPSPTLQQRSDHGLHFSFVGRAHLHTRAKNGHVIWLAGRYGTPWPLSVIRVSFVMIPKP